MVQDFPSLQNTYIKEAFSWYYLYWSTPVQEQPIADIERKVPPKYAQTDSCIEDSNNTLSASLTRNMAITSNKLDVPL